MAIHWWRWGVRREVWVKSAYHLPLNNRFRPVVVYRHVTSGGGVLPLGVKNSLLWSFSVLSSTSLGSILRSVATAVFACLLFTVNWPVGRGIAEPSKYGWKLQETALCCDIWARIKITNREVLDVLIETLREVAKITWFKPLFKLLLDVAF